MDPFSGDKVGRRCCGAAAHRFCGGGGLAKGQKELLMRRRWRALWLGQLVALRNHASLGPVDVDID